MMLQQILAAGGDRNPLTEIAIPIVVALLLIVGIPVWLTQRHKGKVKQRSSNTAAWAAANGFTYEPEKPDLVGRWNGYPFGRGWKRQVADYLAGQHRGLLCIAFEYRWEENDQDQVSTHRYTICATPLPKALPDLTLGAESTLPGPLKRLAGKDIQLGQPEFDQAWKVGGDEAFARALLPGPVMALLMSPGFPRFNFTIQGNDLLIATPRALDPAVLPERFDALAALAQAIPPQVWDTWGR
ncbi:MAG: hypothetical protein LBR19_08040 [Bifidobacteriaceae bacterium]|jgi:hypothetical protein|nr:hypothetical protein [Bifidobacteriaceae bacterium]